MATSRTGCRGRGATCDADSGDLLTIALQGDRGKPQPALVIQSCLLQEHASITVLPLTCMLTSAPLLRITLRPNGGKGLRVASQVMIDRAHSVLRPRLRPVFGHADDNTMLAVNRALIVFLGLV